MKKERSPFRGLLGRAQKSFVRSRPGSVLILVVALLVLMALIGTAYMSMAQQDRVISSQHTNNNEIDLLMDGLAKIASSAVTQDLYNQGKYRPAAGYNNPTVQGYNHLTGLGFDSATLGTIGFTNTNAGSSYLSARVPELFQEIGTNSGTPGMGNEPMWSFITAPLIGGRFSTPIAPANATSPFLYGQNFSGPNANLYTYSERSSRMGWPTPLYPGVYPGTNLPAWVDNPDAPTNAVVAADADGDGIPDSGLIKLPIGSINGLTYYAAFRIVDDSSAVNVNTAWQHNPLIGTGTASAGVASLPGDFFPTSIDLAALAADSLAAFLQYHFDGTPPLYPYSVWPAIDDTGTLRADLNNQFNTAMEASWTQLGRRVNYPGFSSAGFAFQAFQRSDELALLHHFIIRDPQAESTLEQMLPSSLVTAAPTSPYSPNTPGTASNWYFTNFAFLAREFAAGVQNTVPLRSIVTTENPVSNYAPNTYNDRGLYVLGNTYAFGDSVIASDNHRYVCINPLTASGSVSPPTVQPGPWSGVLPPAPLVPGQSQSNLYDNDTWVQMPWADPSGSDAPTKISVNTGTFGQLWLAYWSVMAEQTVTAGNQIITSAPSQNPLNPAIARMFRSPLRVPPPAGTGSAATPPAIPGMGLTPLQVMQLRAAIAAVNTIDMRDTDDDVTSRVVALIDGTNVNPNMQVVYATVYGQEPQPFITEVYATNQPAAPATGYVAIKLFNPYNFPLTLANYRLGIIHRDNTIYTATSTPPARTISEITPDTPTFWTTNPPVIPANSFIIISSQSGPYSAGAVTLPSDIVTAPVAPAQLSPGQFAQYIMGNLTNALDNELVLLRPRQGYNPAYGASGTPTSATGSIAAIHNSINNYNESNLADLVPVDSYDLSGLAPLVPPAAAIEWHYLRPSDAETVGDQATSWHWVYPGHYRFNTVTTPTAHSEMPGPRLDDGTHSGLFPGGSFNSTVFIPSGPLNPPAPPIGDPVHELWQMGHFWSPGSGTFQTGHANFYVDVPLRLNAPDSAGPNNPFHITRATGAAEPWGHPFGGFARNGDILQVPFIGSYRLTLTPTLLPSGTFLEMNPVTMDSVMALASAQVMWNEVQATATETAFPTAITDNCDPLNLKTAPPAPAPQVLYTYENIGRFCPLNITDNANSTSKVLIDDFGINPLNWRYHFGTRLFDFLTVQSPQQDYFPDVDPAPSDPYVTANPRLPYKYPFTSLSAPIWVPLPVANSTKSIVNAEETNLNAATEQSVGVQGLININTAPWRVLATVPWLPPSGSPASLDNGPRSLNAAIAMSIVYYRDILDPVLNKPHGPFKSLFELNNVPITVAPPFNVPTTGNFPAGTLFKNVLLYSTLFNSATYTDLSRGDLQAAYTTNGTDITQGDYQIQMLMLNRISNLVTTRSDHFTAYILLQGWKNAETPQATLVVQRRAAYLIDRTGVIGSSNPTPAMTYISNN